MESIHDTETPPLGAADERLAVMARLAQGILMETVGLMLERGTVPPREVDAALRLVRDEIEVQMISPLAVGEHSPFLCPKVRRSARELARLLIHGQTGQTGHESHECLCMNDSDGSGGPAGGAGGSNGRGGDAACACSTGAAQPGGSGEA